MPTKPALTVVVVGGGCPAGAVVVSSFLMASGVSEPDSARIALWAANAHRVWWWLWPLVLLVLGQGGASASSRVVWAAEPKWRAFL